MNKLGRHLLSTATSTAYWRSGNVRLPVLMYHRVLAQPDPLQPGVPDAAQADLQFQVLAELFKILPMDEAAELLREDRLPPRSVCITFDDGYRDNHDVALPLLAKHGLTATFYIANGFLDGGRMFNDTVLEAVRRLPVGTLDLSHWGLTSITITDTASRVSAIQAITRGIKYFAFEKRQAFCDELAHNADTALPDDVMMSTDQIRVLAKNGMSIGGHTVNHPILEKVDDATAQREIITNRKALHSLLGTVPRTFAYPNGKPHSDYSKKHAHMVREAGYQAAVSTAFGVGDRNADIYQLPRFVLNEASYMAVFSRLLRMSSHVGKGHS